MRHLFVNLLAAALFTLAAALGFRFSPGCCCETGTGTGTPTGTGTFPTGTGTIPPGTGSSTDTLSGTVFGCDHCPDGAPFYWALDVYPLHTNIPNDYADYCANCHDNEGTHVMVYCGGCTWQEDECVVKPGDPYGCGNESWVGWTLQPPGTFVGDFWVLFTGVGETWYTCPGEYFDCAGPNVFTKAWGSNTPICSWPEEIIIYPL